MVSFSNNVPRLNDANTMKKNYLKKLYAINQGRNDSKKSHKSSDRNKRDNSNNPMMASVQQSRLLNNQYSEYLLTGQSSKTTKAYEPYKRGGEYEDRRSSYERREYKHPLTSYGNSYNQSNRRISPYKEDTR